MEVKVLNLQKDSAGQLWPIHLKPKQDELLSSWLFRLATAHGLNLVTLLNIWSQRFWQNADLDRTSAEDLLYVLSQKTGTPYDRVYGTTLRAYEGWLFEKIMKRGNGRWIFKRETQRNNIEGFWIQFCPLCLSEDEPYYRRKWRLAFVVACTKHNVRLLDRCSRCLNALNFCKNKLSDKRSTNSNIVVQCYRCGFDLRDAARDISKIDSSLVKFQHFLENVLGEGWGEVPNFGPVYSVLFFDGLFLLLRTLTSQKPSLKLQEAVTRRYSIEGHIPFTPGKGLTFVDLNLLERQSLLSIVHNLFTDWPAGFIECCRSANLWSDTLIPKKAPFWLWSVVSEHLQGKARRISYEEITYIAKFIRKSGKPATKQELTKYVNKVHLVHRSRRVLYQNDGRKKKPPFNRKCPYCKDTAQQVRIKYLPAKFEGATDRYQLQCKPCSRMYTFPPAPRGYPDKIRKQAVFMRLKKGMKYDDIAAALAVNKATIARWCLAHKTSQGK